MPRYPYQSAYSHRYSIADSQDEAPLSPQQRRSGLWYFLKHNLSIILALLFGIVCIIGVALFTFWLSKQTNHCPTWSIECHVSSHVEHISNNIGTVQGLVTAIYAIGLAALAYSAHALSESAFWPLLNRQALTIKQMHTYLEASRGSIPSSLSALLSARNLDSVIIILCTTFITLIPLGGAPLVGYVYDQRNISMEFKSLYQLGAGIEPLYVQTNPTGPYRDGAGGLYASWSNKLASEPMPEYRDWFIDRQALSDRGNMTIGAVRVKQNIDCKAWNVDRPEMNNGLLWFKTNMEGHHRTNGTQHSEKVSVRDKPSLAVWVHDYNFTSPTRTVAKLVFAAFNGTIDGGLTTFNISDKASITNITGIACNIDIELVDDTLVIGTGGKFAPVTTNAIKNLREPGDETTNGTLNELALWLAVAPVANGASVEGAQPMYAYRNDSIPVRYTSTNEGPNQGWTMDYIKDFIRNTIGASLLAESKRDGADGVIITSVVYMMKLDPSRPVVLAILPSLVLINGLLLLLWNVYLHRSLDIPIMRKATLSELLKSSQTKDVQGPAATDRMDDSKPSSLVHLELSYFESSERMWGLYNPHRRAWSKIKRRSTPRPLRLGNEQLA